MLWAITSYFNSEGYKSRLANYRIFRQRLSAPLAAVELSFNEHFELRSGDADVLIQLRGRDVLWHKERLLNLAISHLPPDCDEVAWLDCDAIFMQDDWPQRAGAALKRFALVHLFSERCNLRSGWTSDSLGSDSFDSVAQGFAYRLATGQATADDLRTPGAAPVRGFTTGLAWAARRGLIEEHGLYDACVVGGSDKAAVCAAIGKFEYALDALQMNLRQAEHYLAWARRFHASVRGRIGHIDGRVLHLWHGAMKDRRYGERYQGLKRFAFDPFTDIALDARGCWRWNTAKPQMHEYVRGYFNSRNEDSRGPELIAFK